MELTLPGKLQKALEREAEDAKRTLHAHLVRKLENITPPAESIDPKPLHANLPRLVAYLERMPGVSVLSSEVTRDAYWWVKLTLDLAHPLAWRVVQELGFVLNDLSLQEKLPTVFKDVYKRQARRGSAYRLLRCRPCSRCGTSSCHRANRFACACRSSVRPSRPSPTS